MPVSPYPLRGLAQLWFLGLHHLVRTQLLARALTAPVPDPPRSHSPLWPLRRSPHRSPHRSPAPVETTVVLTGGEVGSPARVIHEHRLWTRAAFLFRRLAMRIQFTVGLARGHGAVVVRRGHACKQACIDRVAAALLTPLLSRCAILLPAATPAAKPTELDSRRGCRHPCTVPATVCSRIRTPAASIARAVSAAATTPSASAGAGASVRSCPHITRRNNR